MMGAGHAPLGEGPSDIPTASQVDREEFGPCAAGIATQSVPHESARKLGNQGARVRLLALLCDDHQRFATAAQEVEGKPEATREVDAIVTRACEEFIIHGQLEQEILYPAFRASIPQKLLVDEASVEHDSIATLVAELRALGPGHALYLPTFTVLCKLIRMHVDDEEGELFRLLADVDLDWEGLTRQWNDRKATLMGEHGLTVPEDEFETRP